jgi:hypothetical protein
LARVRKIAPICLRNRYDLDQADEDLQDLDQADEDLQDLDQADSKDSCK